MVVTLIPAGYIMRKKAGSDQCAARLATFDTLDFDARHIEDLKGMFVYAPNTNIAVHPIRICSGDYTARNQFMVGFPSTQELCDIGALEHASATSGGPKEFSSGSPNSSGSRAPD